MKDYKELKRLAEAFPSDLDYDSNTELFFNGPSGESLGGGSTGFYCVYGAPFEIDGEQYDGHTYVETCKADFAKFMVAAREGVLSLLAENEILNSKIASMNVSGFADAFYIVAEKLGVTGARPISPMQVFQSEILPALEEALKDSSRYRFFRENSLRIVHASSQCWVQRLDSAIDEAMTEVTNQ